MYEFIAVWLSVLIQVLTLLSSLNVVLITLLHSRDTVPYEGNSSKGLIFEEFMGQ